MYKLTSIYTSVIGIGFLLISEQGYSQQQNRPAPVSVPGAPGWLITPPASYPAGIKVNYVRTREAIHPITDPSVMATADYQNVKQVSCSM